jgi:hypothetical protein
MWSVRGRFGVAVDRAFVYATAGWAQARFNYTFNLNDTDTGVATGDLSFTTDGVVIGAGAEWAGWNNIVVGAEYLHYAFGDEKLLPSVPVIGPFGAAGDHITLKTVDVVRLRASYCSTGAGADTTDRESFCPKLQSSGLEEPRIPRGSFVFETADRCPKVKFLPPISRRRAFGGSRAGAPKVALRDHSAAW